MTNVEKLHQIVFETFNICWPQQKYTSDGLCTRGRCPSNCDDCNNCDAKTKWFWAQEWEESNDKYKSHI